MWCIYIEWGIFLFGRLNEKFVPGVELPAGDELKCISFHFVVCPHIVADKLLKWKQANIEHRSVGFPFKPQVTLIDILPFDCSSTVVCNLTSSYV